MDSQFSVGDIVYFNRLKFNDGDIDKKEKRPCIILNIKNNNSGNPLLYCIPVTTNTLRFNNHNNEYVMIIEPIYNYKKISYAKLNNLFLVNAMYAHKTEIKLSQKCINIITEKLKLYYSEQKHNKIYDSFFNSCCNNGLNNVKKLKR